MIKAGDTLENPITGERLVFHKTAADTDGEAVVFEAFVKPGGGVPVAHLHPAQDERFEVLRGAVNFRLDDQEIVARPGERIVVPAGMTHRFWNASDEDVHFVCEVRPALQFEQLIETMFALANDGKFNRKGLPNPLRLAVIARASFDTLRLPFPPVWMQRAGLALAAPLGWLLGYRATYEPRGAAVPAPEGV